MPPYQSKFQHGVGTDERTLNMRLCVEKQNLAERHENATQWSRRDAVSIYTDRFGKRRSFQTRRSGFVKYAYWTLHASILMQFTRARAPTLPLNVGPVQWTDFGAKSPNPLADHLRTTDTIRTITNMRKSSFSGKSFDRIEFALDLIVPSSLPSKKALRHPDIHAHVAVLALQSNPPGSKAAPQKRKVGRHKLSRSIEPA